MSVVFLFETEIHSTWFSTVYHSQILEISPLTCSTPQFQKLEKKLLDREREAKRERERENLRRFFVVVEILCIEVFDL